MTANEADQATGRRSTRPEAAGDAPTGNPSQPRPTLPEGMGELDRRAIDTVRVLAMDAVQKAGNGHPGTAR
jgi:transketolase